jgi:diadenosine tetraphosphate (Ap4A) HIT family hydrolase
MCVFCEVNKNLLLKETEYSRLIINYFPLGKFALLVIPKRHVRLLSDLTKVEVIDLSLLHWDAMKIINEKLNVPDLIGWFNQGVVVGETVHHFHFHVALFEPDGNLKPVERLGTKIPIETELINKIKSYF